MRLDGATISIERRTLAECFDLAFLFCRAHLARIMAVVGVFAVPACALTWLGAERTDAGLLLALTIYFLVSPFLGAALALASGHQVFGDPIGLGRTLRLFLERLPALALALLFARFLIVLAGSFFVIPGVILAVRWGFLQEIITLERLGGRRLMRRNDELLRGVGPRLFQGHCAVLCYHAVLAVTAFLLVDLAATTLFNVPIFSARLSRSSVELFLESFFDLLFHDSLSLTTFSAMLWLTFPLARLAWFFHYLDVRIRKEGWDLELELKVEGRRLEASS